MSDKTKLIMIIGSIVILALAILLTPNPNFGLQSFLLGNPTANLEIIADPTFSKGGESTWKIDKKTALPALQGEMLKLNVAGETMRLTHPLDIRKFDEVSAFKVVGTLSSPSNTKPTFAFIAEDGTILLRAIIESTPYFEMTIPYTAELKRLFTEKKKIDFSLDLPPNTTWDVESLRIEPLYEVQ